MTYNNIKSSNNAQECVICKGPINGWGNNPHPISTVGKCCDYCNHLVMSKRLADFAAFINGPISSRTRSKTN